MNRHLDILQSRPRFSAGSHSEQGFALVFGLLLLVVMSLIGLTMMSTNRLETTLSGGERETGIAFQAAEAALRDAEAVIDATLAVDDPNAFPPGSQANTAPIGHIAEDQTEPADMFDSASWLATNSREFTDGVAADYPELAANVQPRFIIKHVGEVTDPASKLTEFVIRVYGEGSEVPSVDIFRTTARGTSRDGSAITILQSYWGKIYP